MNNERFMVPEILFRPSDIGIQQVNPLDEAWSHFAVIEKKKNMAITHISLDNF